MLRRTRRRLVNIAPKISAVILLMVVLGWVHSHWYHGRFCINVGQSAFGLYWHAGQLALISGPRAGAPNQIWTFRTSSFRGAGGFGLPNHCRWSYGDFGLAQHQIFWRWGERLIPHAVCPFWFLALLSAPLPIATCVRIQRKRRKRPPHICRSCGYDLRGTLAAGRTQCPECGWICVRGMNQADVSEDRSTKHSS